MVDLMQIKTAYTHAGVFHADDVFSSALLKLINPNIKIKRISSVSKITETDENSYIVFDIGGGRYDHHQENAEIRDNDIPYAAFGLLWRDFYTYFLSKEESFKTIDFKFVQKIDASDNGYERAVTSEIFNALNPTWDSEETPDEAFNKALNLAIPMLEAVIKKQQSIEKAEVYAKNIPEDEQIVVLDKFMPISSYLYKTAALFLVFPSNRDDGYWTATTIKKGKDQLNLSFPIEWSTNLPKGLTFCHKGGFLITGNDKEILIDLLKELIKEANLKTNS